MRPEIAIVIAGAQLLTLAVFVWVALSYARTARAEGFAAGRRAGFDEGMSLGSALEDWRDDVDWDWPERGPVVGASMSSDLYDRARP